jgi:hypothetical protein
MKVVRNTPEQLIIKSVPWALGLVFVVIIVALIGGGLNGLIHSDYSTAIMMGVVGPLCLIGLAALFVARNDLILDRSRNKIEMRRSTLFGRTKVQHALTDLEKAIVQMHKSKSTKKRTSGPTYRAALVLTGGMDAGVHPVTEVYSSGPSAERMTATINDWLAQNVDSRAHRA